ncbi:Hpt domain-containing protein [Ideonella sp.]|uniref:hybrid sensor histidine kinase/response regulator n=1 Tax=Ideonella sp. TaxID=1929293 RepID=UPI0035B17122
MPSDRDQTLPGDLSALAWVQEELRRTLDQAHKSLRRHLRDLEQRAGAEPEADAPPTALLQARTLMHQGVGALEMIGLPAAARCLNASEQAVSRLIDRTVPLDNAAIEAIEHASFALLDFLRRELAGQPLSPLTLFPQYKAVLAMAKVDRIHPADLWEAEDRSEPVPSWDSGFAPLEPDQEVHAAIESAMLKALRSGDNASLHRMSDLFAGLSSSAQGRTATLWQLASAFYEAQAVGALKADLYTKRLVSRLLAQLRAVERGATDGPGRLLRDLRFFCAQARPVNTNVAPRLAQVRRSMALGNAEPVNYDVSPLGRFDPAIIPLARKRVSALKETWSALVSGDTALGAAVPEQAALVAESVRQIYPQGDELSAALMAATQRGHTPSPALAMEVATALLCVDASLDDIDLDRPEMQQRMHRLAQRLSTVTAGGEQPPVEPWMEVLYREVSDRQTMGSVVAELRASLAEIEQQLDRFSRQPDDKELLKSVPGELAAMRGVLSVLGLDQASLAVQRMRDDVDAMMLATEAGEDMAGRLADNVGGLSFMIDMLGVQPQLAKTLFRFNAETGRFAAVMGHTRVTQTAGPAAEAGLIEQAQSLVESATAHSMSDDDLSRTLDNLSNQAVAADAPQLAVRAAQARDALASAASEAERDAARADIAQTMGDFVAKQEPPPPPESPRSRPMPLDEEPDDMREIFFEEAREVVEGGEAALAQLAEQPQDLEALTVLRRAFHTLKGSSRMVGLKDYGEAAWACEQLFNARLAEAVVEADPALRDFSTRALSLLSQWVDALSSGRGNVPDGRPLAKEAEALRLRQDVAAPAPAPAPVAAPAVESEPPLIDLSSLDTAPMLEPSMASPFITADTLPELPSLDLPALPEVQELSDADLALPELHEPAAEATLPADIEPTTLRLPAEPAAAPTPTPAPAPVARRPAREPGAEWASTAEMSLGDLLGESLNEEPEELASQALESVDLELDLELPIEPPAVEAAPEPEQAVAAEAVAAEVPAELAPLPEPVVEETAAAATPAEAAPEDDADRYKVVGPLRIQIALFNIFLNEADEQSRRLGVEIAEWQHELDRPVGEAAVALAHSLAGNSAAVGYSDLSNLARRLEHGLERSVLRGMGQPDEARLFADVGDEIRRLLHQFAAGFLKPVATELLARLDAHEAREAQEALAAGRSSLAPLDGPVSAVMNFGPVPSEPMPLQAPAAPAPMAEVAEAAEVPEPVPPAPAPAEEEAPVAAPVAMAPPAPVAELATEPDEEEAGPVTMQAPLGAVRFTSLSDEQAPSDVDEPVPVSVAREGLWGDFTEDLDTEDSIDEELIPIFIDEGRDLIPALAQAVRQWEAEPQASDSATAAMRVLHTIKGSSRLAGAMRLGEIAHRLETAIGQVTAQGTPDAAVLSHLHSGVDALAEEFQRLLGGGAPAEKAKPAPAVLAPPVPAPAAAALPTVDVGVVPKALPVAEAPAKPEPVTAGGATPTAIDWGRFAVHAAAAPGAGHAGAEMGGGIVRVRAPLLERLVSHAGEVGIARARIESDMGQLQGALKELTDNLDRLRRQLRDLELQAETQMTSRMEAARHSQQAFDPLEMDRFTRVQELTRMLAESVGDVGTVQRGIQLTLQSTEDQLAFQARLTRDLQDDLLRARMVEFDTLSDRLYRTVRQAAKESGKQVRLNLVGGAIELDRSVLDRMAPAFEHLLRNAVAHGIETPAVREATGKDPHGNIEVSLHQAGNEVRIEVRDDGAGLNLARIAERARRLGLLAADAKPTEGELAGLIFTPGFSTADQITELAGRGVGMDVVRAEVTSLGGRIETASATGRGTAFQLVLPLTTAVTQVVALACGELHMAVPATLVETVRRVPVAEVEAAYHSGVLRHGDQEVPFFWLGSLLQHGLRGAAEGKTTHVVIARSAQQRVALHVSQVLGNQEVVVKNLGPQLGRLPGLAGMSLLASGETVLIYNPVALATIYGDDARQRLVQWLQEPTAPVMDQLVEPSLEETLAVVSPVTEGAIPRNENRAPLVMVVDDSLTVRRVTQRLLLREGYRVVLARDGLDALEQLADERPAVMLSDIEMPRMDGFDLVRNVRNDARLQDLPVIMITSRIAQKHREHAQELGVDHYLGKPYDEDALLALVRSYAQPAVPA